MDFEAWLAAPHPPTELLEAIVCGERSFQELAPFAEESPEKALWVADLKRFRDTRVVLHKLLTFYKLRDICERNDAELLVAVNRTRGAKHTACLVQGGRRHHPCCASNEAFGSGLRMGAPCVHAELFEAATDVVKDMIATCEKEEDGMRQVCAIHRKNLWALEVGMRDLFGK